MNKLCEVVHLMQVSIVLMHIIFSRHHGLDIEMVLTIYRSISPPNSSVLHDACIINPICIGVEITKPSIDTLGKKKKG